MWTHESAVIDNGASIGEGTKVWHFSHVCSDVIIGSNCTLGQNVFVGNQVNVGNNVKIQNNVSVYEGVVLENDVFCGPSVVFTNVHNPRSAVNRKDEFRKTVVMEGATLGANCTIVCGVTIGKHAFVGAGAVVTKDLPDFCLVAGVPAKQIGWMSKYGERLELPISGNGVFKCTHTGDSYELNNGVVRIRGENT